LSGKLLHRRHGSLRIVGTGIHRDLEKEITLFPGNLFLMTRQYKFIQNEVAREERA
jgi:hypothetical protein